MNPGKIHVKPASRKSFANQGFQATTWHGEWRHRESSYINTSSVFPELQPSQSCFSYFLAYVCHSCPSWVALISSFLIFSILVIPITHLNILIFVLSSESCPAFLSAQVSLPYTRTGLMTVFLLIHNHYKVSILLSHTIPDISCHFPYPVPTRCLTSSSHRPFPLIIEPDTAFDLISGLFAYVIFGKKTALISEPPWTFFCGKYCQRALCNFLYLLYTLSASIPGAKLWGKEGNLYFGKYT